MSIIFIYSNLVFFPFTLALAREEGGYNKRVTSPSSYTPHGDKDGKKRDGYQKTLIVNLEITRGWNIDVPDRKT